MSPTVAWAVIILGFILPLAHVAVAPGLSTPTTGPDGNGKPSSCPFSPRMGWIVIVLFLGPIGWLMFVASRLRRQKAMHGAGSAPGEAISPDADKPKI